MRIALLGGSFNPIHKGHIFIAQEVLRQMPIDEVWFVVSPQNPFKKSADLMDETLRLALVTQALDGIPRLRPCDKEYHLTKPSYMSQTLRALQQDYPEDTFILLIGADNWGKFAQWHDSNYILDNYDIYIYPRQNCPINPHDLPPRVTFLALPTLDIAASDIRQQLFSGTIPYDLLPENVIKTLQEYYSNNTQKGPTL